MSERLSLFQFKHSANSIKVRIALNYKGLAFDRVDVDPQDRTAVVKLSGQPLTPVLSHGNTVVFDSASILRYLDANFRSTPPLFSTDYGQMQQIERWEIWARKELGEPFYLVLGQWRANTRDAEVFEQASRRLHELTERIEEQLGKGDWLVGDRMSAADVTAAPSVYSGMLPAKAAEGEPRLKFFADALKLGEGRERTRAWAERVMAYNR